MTSLNVGEAKNQLSKLLARVESGEEVLIARDGVPVVRLVPVEKEEPGETFLRRWESAQPGDLSFDDEKFEFTEAELDALFYDGDAS